jgi:shikimate dehydrogenase
VSVRPSRLVLLGHPVAHSLSPLFQNAALRSAGVPLEYAALDVAPERLDAVLDALAREGAAGNVTVPHKSRVAARCARLTPLAARVGAVNTFWSEDGSLVGDNTDVGGFDAAVETLLGGRPRAARIALLGAGGGAAAVLAAAESWPESRVTVYARSVERAAALAERFPRVARASDSVGAIAEDATLVVNATPVGLLDEAHPVPVEALPRDAAVIDLVYRRGETSWVRAARAGGHRAVDGLEMLLEQGALAFVRWFGFEPDRVAMRRALMGAARA